jgi:uncharacterized membrane protein
MTHFTRLNHETYIQTIRTYLDKLDDQKYAEVMKKPELVKFVKETNYERK